METHNQQGAGTRGAGRKFAPAGTLRGNGTEAARERARERRVSEVDRKELDVVDMEDARCDAMALWAQPAEPWKPKEGERFFCICANGEVVSVHFHEGYEADSEHVAFGNCFRTREEAESARERVRVALKRGVPKDEVFREASERLTRAMQEADNGQRATDSGNASGGFSGENGRGSEYSSGNPAGTRNAWSARTPSAENSVVVSGEYRVVDADELTFVDVSDKAQQNEQERNRQGRRTQQQTLGMLYDFVAERLLEDAHTDRGAPIYRELEDGKLRSVSGEGRSRLLKNVYESGGEPEAQYRAALEKFARERGIEIPAGIKNPVLVRVAKDTGGMSWAALAKASNMDMKSAYSTAERAHADARELGKCLPLLNARSEDDLLGEKNHAFVVAFVQAVNAGTEYVQDRKEGFKETLATRIQEALVAYVIGDREAATDLFDSPYSLKNALNTLMDLAVDLARLKENERYDVSRELAAALKAALAVRELKRKGDARTTEQLIETHFEGNALEGIGENVRAGLDLGAAKMLANLMLDRKTGLFGRTLIGYVSEVERENGLEGNDIGLFGAETDWGTKSELMKRALDKANGEKQTRYSLAGYEAEQSVLAQKYSIDAGTASLVGLHEISEEKLRKAIALGGLANPSLGVVDLNARAGEGTVSALCRRGMPCVLIGRTQSRTKGCRPRFLVADVTAWLKRNSNHDVEL